MTSAVKLTAIINELLSAKPASLEEAYEALILKDLLPKKLIPVLKPVKKVSPFASQAAEDLADTEGILPDSLEGSGNKGKITVKDIQNLLKATKVKVNASPSAQTFARDNGLDLGTVSGSGVDGRILLKDVREAKPQDEPDSSEPARKISSKAKKIIEQFKLDEADIREVVGSGKNGTIVEADLKELVDAQEKSDDDDESSSGED